MFIFGKHADVEKAQDWMRSWIGPKDLAESRDIIGWKETRERESRRRPGESSLKRDEGEYGSRDAPGKGINRGEMEEGAGFKGRVVRSPVPQRGNIVSRLRAIAGECTALRSPQPPPGDLRAKLNKQRSQSKEGAIKTGKSRSRLEVGVLKKPEVERGSPMRFGKSTEEEMEGRDCAKRSFGMMRRDRSRSAGRLMQEINPRELRSRSTPRLIVEDLEKSEKERGRLASKFTETSNLHVSHLDSDRPRRMTRSMSTARVPVENGGRAEGEEGGRRRTREERRGTTTRQCDSSWQHFEGRDGKREEKTLERRRSISTGRIPLEGQRSISSSRVGIGARRVRKISFIFAIFPI